MDLGTAGRVAVVTGGARGIGRAVAEELVYEGADVAVLDIWQERIDDVVSWPKDPGRQALGRNVYVAQAHAVATAVETLATRVPMFGVGSLYHRHRLGPHGRD
jgi:3-oxoacyl-[acyl-carrier protein] reductase